MDRRSPDGLRCARLCIRDGMEVPSMTARHLAYRRGVRRGETKMLEKMLLLGAAALLGYVFRESLG